MRVLNLSLKIVALPVALLIVGPLPMTANAQPLQDGWYYFNSQESGRDRTIFNFLELKGSSETKFRMIGISVPNEGQGAIGEKYFMPMTYHQVDCRRKKTRMYMADFGLIAAKDINAPSRPYTFSESEQPWQNIPEEHIPYNFICEGKLLLSNDRYAGVDLQAIFNKVINSVAKP